MSRPLYQSTSLRFTCPRCGAAPGELCTSDDGVQGIHGQRWNLALTNPDQPALPTMEENA